MSVVVSNNGHQSDHNSTIEVSFSTNITFQSVHEGDHNNAVRGFVCLPVCCKVLNQFHIITWTIILTCAYNNGTDGIGILCNAHFDPNSTYIHASSSPNDAYA